jgi:hypothetical protein
MSTFNHAFMQNVICINGLFNRYITDIIIGICFQGYINSALIIKKTRNSLLRVFFGVKDTIILLLTYL